jgi:hypothetical protein
MDCDRIIAPLRPAKDAIILSNDRLTVAEVTEKVVKSYYQKTQALIFSEGRRQKALIEPTFKNVGLK